MQPGLEFIDYAKACDTSQPLTLIRPDGMSPQAWLRQRPGQPPQGVGKTSTSRLLDDVWIQVSEQRTPGGGTAILQTDITELIHMERQEREKLLDEQARLIRATLDHINQGILHLRRPPSGWSAGTPGSERCFRRRSS